MKQANKLWLKKMAGLLTENEERALAVAGNEEEDVPPMGDEGGMDDDMGDDMGGMDDDHVGEEENVFDKACVCLDEVEEFINSELSGVEEGDPRMEEYQNILSLKQQLCDAMSAHTASYGQDDEMGDEFGGEEDMDMGGEEDFGGEEDMGGDAGMPPPRM
jgi:hypothetical protein